jgi:hypothetical protein
VSGRLHRHETRRFALTLDETRPIGSSGRSLRRNSATRSPVRRRSASPRWTCPRSRPTVRGGRERPVHVLTAAPSAADVESRTATRRLRLPAPCRRSSVERGIRRGAHPLTEHDLEAGASRGTDERPAEARASAGNGATRTRRSASPSMPARTTSASRSRLTRTRTWRPDHSGTAPTDQSDSPSVTTAPTPSTPSAHSTRLDPPPALTDEDACLVEL